MHDGISIITFVDSVTHSRDLGVELNNRDNETLKLNSKKIKLSEGPMILRNISYQQIL